MKKIIYLGLSISSILFAACGNGNGGNGGTTDTSSMKDTTTMRSDTSHVDTTMPAKPAPKP